MVGLARSEIKPDSRERCSASTALPDYEIVLFGAEVITRLPSQGRHRGYGADGWIGE